MASQRDSRIRRWWAWTLLVAYFVASLSPAQGLVLCIGEDGHLAIEAATAQAACFDCPDGEPAADSCCSEESDEHDESCSCSDIPLLAGAPDVTRARANDRVLIDAAACALVGAQPFAVLQSPCTSTVLARTAAPPRPRVPELLVLRV